MQHRQYPALDILKFVLAFSVIAQHAQVIPALGPFSHLGEAVLWPAVSLFFAVSGFLCYDKVQGISDAKQRRETLESRLLRSCKALLGMYVWWTLLFLPLNLGTAYMAGELNMDYMFNLLRIFVFSGLFPHAPQLWYLLALGLGFLILYWSTRHRVRLSLMFTISAILCAAAFVIPYADRHIPVFAIVWRATFADTRNVFFTGLFYITGGAMIAVYRNALERYMSRWKWAVPLILVVSFLGMVFVTATSHMVFAAAFILTLITVLVSIRSDKAFKKLRNLSTIVFLIHFYFIDFAGLIVGHMGLSTAPASFMVFLIAAACSCLTALLILPLIHRNRLLSALFHC